MLLFVCQMNILSIRIIKENDIHYEKNITYVVKNLTSIIKNETYIIIIDAINICHRGGQKYRKTESNLKNSVFDVGSLIFQFGINFF